MKLLPLGLLLLATCLAHAQAPATPAPAPQSDVQKWIANTDATWQATFAREVTAPFDTEIGKLRQQYTAATEASMAKLAAAGNLDQTLVWRAERDRFNTEQNVPPEDDAALPPALKQLRANWRLQSARLEKEKADHARALVARYDQLLAQAQKQLTQAQRIDDALLIKKLREDVAARWTPAAVPAPAVAAVEPAESPKPAPAQSAKSGAAPAPKGAKLNPHEILARLLAAGAKVNIGEYRSRQEMHQASDAPEKFAFYDVHWSPRKDGAPVTDDDLAPLESIESLKGLALSGLEITDAGLEHVRAMHGLPWLSLGNLPKVTAAGLKVLAELPAIETIVLEKMPDPEAAIKAAAANKRLTRLEMLGMPVSDASLAAIAANSTLVVVTFDKGTTGLTAAGFAPFPKMRRLTTLTFIDFPVDDAMAAEIGKIESLQHLDILQSGMTEAGVVSLSKLRNLTDLRITAPPVTPTALAALKKLRSLKSLTVGRPTPPDDADKLRAALKGVEIKQ